MPVDVMKCVNCTKMDIEDGYLPKEFIEYDFAEDALDFECPRPYSNLPAQDILLLKPDRGKTKTIALSTQEMQKHGYEHIFFLHSFTDWDTTSATFRRSKIQLSEARDVKFTQTLSDPLSIGSYIVCTGTPTEDLPWFAVNIGCGDVESGHADIAVHFNVRFPQCYVVRNTRRHDKWGTEETTAFRLFPFKLGKQFTIEVLVDEKETLWAVDGEHYCSFAHRSPSPLSATWVQVTGVRDATLKVDKTDVYPRLAAPPVEVPLRPGPCSVPINEEPSWRPNVIATLSNGVPEGHQVVIYGRLRPLLHSFAIDLMDGAREWPRANVHVHVNVRAHVDSQLERQLVVLNAWLGAWGPEVRQRTAKLVPGTYTTFRIVRGTGEWLVFADDVLIGELAFRAAAGGVRALRLRGDLYPDQLFLCPATASPLRD